jgi:hypothetical protein
MGKGKENPKPDHRRALFRLPSRSPYRLVLWFPVKRIASLDGLRAISIAMFVVGHLAKSGHGPRIFWTTYAGIGVSIFFVISGYLITTILLKEHSRTSNIRLRDFYIRRAYPIFPAAFVFMLVVFAFYWRNLRWYDMAAAMFYVANLDVHRPWILGHLWSLSIEEQFLPGVAGRPEEVVCRADENLAGRVRVRTVMSGCVLSPPVADRDSADSPHRRRQSSRGLLAGDLRSPPASDPCVCLSGRWWQASS